MFRAFERHDMGLGEQPRRPADLHPGFEYSIAQPVVEGLPGDVEGAADLRGGQHVRWLWWFRIHVDAIKPSFDSAVQR